MITCQFSITVLMVTGVIVLALEGRHDFFLLYQLIGKEKGVGFFFCSRRWLESVSYGV